MWNAFIRQIFLTLITLTILSFISYHILLRDPLSSLAQENYFWGYWLYLTALLRGDLGVSYQTGEQIIQQILVVFPTTLSLCLSASFLSLLLGIPLGFGVAIKHETVIGRFLIAMGNVSFAIPVFWLAIVLLAYASLEQWSISAVGELHPIYDVPAVTGVKIIDIFLSDSPYKLAMIQNALQHLALPTLILSIPATLEILRITHLRASYVMQQNYVKVAKARGWSPLKVWRTHILGNTLFPLIPSIARNITLIFAFGMLIENVVSWGGIGRWIITALNLQDYRAISAGVMAIGGFILMIDLLARILTTMLDPYQKKDWYVKS